MKLLIHIIKYFNKRAGKGRGTKIKSDKKAGATTKKVMSPGVPGGGWGPNNLTGALAARPFPLCAWLLLVLAENFLKS